MSFEFGPGAVPASEGNAIVDCGLGYVQRENWCFGTIMPDWDLDPDAPVPEMMFATREQVTAINDWAASWVASQTDSRQSTTTMAPPTEGAVREPESPRNFTVTSPGRPPRLGRPVILDRQVRLARSPATHLISGLKWLLTPKAYSRIVEPLAAQEQHEYFEAIRCGDERLARWIEARMYVLIACNALRALVAPLVKMLKSAS